MKTGIMLVCVLVGCTFISHGGNPDYDPQWRVGDSWRVEMQVTAWTWYGVTTDVRELTYHVEAISATGSTSVAEINVAGTRWTRPLATRLYVDTTSLVVLRRDSDGTNPLGDGPWLDGQIWDVVPVLPTLPTSSVDQVRAYREAEVTQTVHFAGNSVEALIADRNQALAITWEKGKKWWSHATLDIGTNFMTMKHLLTGRVCTARLVEK